MFLDTIKQITRIAQDNSDLTERTVHNKIRKMITETTGHKPVPVGTKNIKTQTVGTYAPVGATCPSSCPFLGHGCYAQAGHVNIHQNHSTSDSEMRAISVAHAVALGVHTDSPTRLHVSGDFYLGDKVDLLYLEGITTALFYFYENWAAARDYLDQGNIWTYTHAPSYDDYSTIDDMIGDFVTVIWSDKAVAGGAVVHPHDKMDTLAHEAGAKPFKCPAQTSGHKVSCKDCKACINPQDRLIVFDPHGPQEGKLKKEFS